MSEGEMGLNAIEISN